jgi:hypothetical protein
VGTSAYIGYTFDFKTADEDDYIFEIIAQVAPDTEFYVCLVTQNLEIGIVAGRMRNEVIQIDKQPGEYTMSISVCDAGDEVEDSAIVIDNIRFRPG